MMEFDANNPTSEQLRSIDIHSLLPQQDPFIMVGCLTEFSELCTVTETVITDDNIFVDNCKFSASGIIENIAQTCAARIGYVNKYILKKGIQIGYIGAIRNLEIYRLPGIGEAIKTCVNVVDEVLGLTLARAMVTAKGETLAVTEIKIAMKEN